MRVIFALACFALTCVAAVSPAHAQFFFSKTFKEGGSVACSSKTIRSMDFGEPRTIRTSRGKRVVGVVNVVDANGKPQKYIVAVSTKKVAWRNLGAESNEVPLKTPDFSCRVRIDVGVAHTCPTKAESPTGSCIVCGKGRCRSVTFSVTRRKL